MDGKKIIYCPKCGRKAGVYDGKATVNIQAKCKKCNKIVVFKPETGETTYSSVPCRATGSGMRYY